MDLLRTCRQIYAETALLPYKTNTFSFQKYVGIKQGLRYLKPFQRAQIVDVQLEIFQRSNLRLPNNAAIEGLAQLSKYNLDFLPALKRLHILIFSTRDKPVPKVEESTGEILRDLNVLLAGRRVSITFEATEEHRWEYSTK